MHRSNSYALWTCCLKQDSCFDYGSRHILGPCLSFASFDLARKRWLWHAGTAVSDPKSQMLQHLMTCGFLPIPSAQVPNSSPSSDDRHEINLYAATPRSQRDLIKDQTTNRGDRRQMQNLPCQVHRLGEFWFQLAGMLSKPSVGPAWPAY